ncbi:MAG: DUF6338 family protein [Chloroflexota bacterium]
MPLGIEGLLLFVFIILPGVVARSEADRVGPLPTETVPRSAVRELADALVYSAFLVPLAGLLAVLALWAATSGAYGLLDLLSLGIAGVWDRVRVPTLLAFLAYVFGSLVLAELVGVTRLGTRIRSKLLDWSKIDITDETIWWTVLEARARNHMKQHGWTEVEVFLNVLLTGGRYTGVLLHFPIVDDTAADKDFAIWRASYYGPDEKRAELPPDDVVLLNTRDCRAVEVAFVEKKSIVVTPAPAALRLEGHPPDVTIGPDAPS